MNATVRLSFFLALAAWLVGCSSPDEARVPVQGTVFLGDKPATNGAVVLHPDVAKGNASKHEPRAKIEADGTFHVQTTNQNGAPPGWYKVGVIVTEPSDPANPYSVPRSLIPEKFGNPDESGLTLEVRPNALPGAYGIKLDAK